MREDMWKKRESTEAFIWQDFVAVVMSAAALFACYKIIDSHSPRKTQLPIQEVYRDYSNSYEETIK